MQISPRGRRERFAQGFRSAIDPPEGTLGPGGVALEKGFSKGKFPLDGSFPPAFLAVEKRGPVRRDGAKFPQAPLAPSAGPGGAGPYESTRRRRKIPAPDTAQSCRKLRLRRPPVQAAQYPMSAPPTGRCLLPATGRRKIPRRSRSRGGLGGRGRGRGKIKIY